MTTITTRCAAFLAIIMAIATAAVPVAANETDDQTASIHAAVTRAVADLNDGDGAAYTALFDNEKIISQIMSALDVDGEMRSQLKEQFRARLDGAGAQMLAKMKPGSARLLRMRNESGSTVAMIRIEFPQGGLGYLDLVFDSPDAAKPRVVNVHDYATGRDLIVVTQFVLTVLTEDNKNLASLLNQLTGTELDSENFSALLNAARSGTAAEVNKRYKALSRAIRQHPNTLKAALLVSSQGGNEATGEQVIKLIARHFADEPDFAFVLLDHDFVNSDYAAALRRIKQFASHVGVPDAPLVYLQAVIVDLIGDVDRSAKLLARVIELQPDYEDAYWYQLTLHAQSGQYDKALAAADILKTRFEYDLPDSFFAQDSAYRKLRQSKQYKAWLEK